MNRVSLASITTLVAALGAVPLQAQWTFTELQPLHSPAPRFGHAIAELWPSGTGLVFGGTDGTQDFGDTWRWNAIDWQLVASTGPAPRSDFGLGRMRVADDSALLFGGRNEQGQLFGDTWEWTGSSWVQRSTSLAPSARSGHALAVDEYHEEHFLLFGGRTAQGLSDETWIWDVDHWTQVLTATRPPAREGHALIQFQGGVFSPSFVTDFLLSGGHDDSHVFADEWLFDGVDWHEVANAGAPEVSDHSLRFTYRGRFMSLGGVDGAPTGVVAERDLSGHWFQHSPANAPTPRGKLVQFVEDPFPSSPTIMLFGGRLENGAALGETLRLTLGTLPSIQLDGTGCGPDPWGGNDGVALLASTPPILGDSMPMFALTKSAPVSVIALVGSEIPAGPFGNCGRRVLPNSIVRSTAQDPFSIGFGTAMIAIPIPFDTSLRGAPLAVQVLAREPSAAHGISLSALVRAVIAD